MSGSMECRVNGMYAMAIWGQFPSTVQALRREMNLKARGTEIRISPGHDQDRSIKTALDSWTV